MRDTVKISILGCCVFTTLLCLTFSERALKIKQEHEFVMKKLELEPRYHVDSLKEVQWRNSYYELLKQCHDAEK